MTMHAREVLGKRRANSTATAVEHRTGRDIFYYIFCFLLFTGPVLAERADSDKPVHLEADRATVQDANKLATFIGNVVLTQGTLIIRADKMTVKEDANGFQHATAFGNLASFRQKRDGKDEYVEGWSERMEYDAKADKVQLFKKARLRRGQDEVHGDYISYDALNEFFQVTGNNDTSCSEPFRGESEAGYPAEEEGAETRRRKR